MCAPGFTGAFWALARAQAQHSEGIGASLSSHEEPARLRLHRLHPALALHCELSKSLCLGVPQLKSRVTGMLLCAFNESVQVKCLERSITWSEPGKH